MSKTHWKKFHNPDYLGAYAFEPNERKVLTIKSAQQQTVKNQQGAEECLVVSFKENEKPLICNVTNSKAIEKVAGSAYIEDWPNVKIELYTTEVSAFGQTVEAVRVKQTPPRVTKPELTPKHQAWNDVITAVKGGYTRAQVESKYTVSDAIWKQITEPQEGE